MPAGILDSVIVLQLLKLSSAVGSISNSNWTLPKEQLELIVSRQDSKHDATRTNAKITLGDRHCGYTLIR
jgi:hypothetical protein